MELSFIYKVGQHFADSRAEEVVEISDVSDKVKYRNIYQKYDGSLTPIEFSKRYPHYLPDGLAGALILGEKVRKGEIQWRSEPEPDIDENSSAVMGSNTKALLLSAHDKLSKIETQLDSYRIAFMLEMNHKKRELDMIRRDMENQLSRMRKKMDKIMRVIETIELYLGINESIVVLTEGKPSEEPIHLRQMLLYIDEEVADTVDQGYDIYDLPKFDNWVIHNLAQILPENKGIVALKPRRYDKDYGDKFENAIMRMHNKSTYLLIRNGENLYRIHSDNLVLGETLFPTKKVAQEMFEAMEKATNNDDYEKAKDQFGEQLRVAILIQGLIDRTQVFIPIQSGINIMKNPEHVRFIYDFEEVLPDGRVRFKEWQKHINSQITDGSRVILAGGIYNPNRDKYYYYGSRRFSGYYANQHSIPNAPSPGLYTVEVYDNQEDPTLHKQWSVLYKAARYWREDPVRSTRYFIYPDDGFLLNYDQIEIEDIEFYLNNRIDRKNYLSMMPVLRELKGRRLAEMKNEAEFVRAMAHDASKPEPAVWRAVEWWKYKVKSKRPITSDDAKAWRMIKSHLLSKAEKRKIRKLKKNDNSR